MKLLAIFTAKQIILGACILLAGWASWGPLRPDVGSDPKQLFVHYLPLAFVLSGGFVLLLALPIQTLLRKKHLYIACLAGAASGIIATSLVISPFYMFPSFEQYFLSTLWLHTTFVLFGLVFAWFFRRKMRLNKSSKPTP